MKLLTPLILIAISVAMYFMYISPTAKDVQALSAKKAEYTNVLEQSKKLKDMRETAQAEYANISESDVSKLDKIIPETFDSVVFVNAVNTVASQYGLVVKDFKFNQPKTDGREAVVTAEQKKSAYKTTGVTFSATGQYSQIIKFLNNTELNLRLVDVTGLSLRAIPGPKGFDSYEFLLDVNTYSLK